MTILLLATVWSILIKHLTMQPEIHCFTTMLVATATGFKSNSSHLDSTTFQYQSLHHVIHLKSQHSGGWGRRIKSLRPAWVLQPDLS
jgi:hypothetical protein